MFGQILRPRNWNPHIIGEYYRRQNGNCIFSVTPGLRAVPSSFSEITAGIDLARIVRVCVTAETGYLGGQKQYTVSSDWIISIFAADAL